MKFSDRMGITTVRTVLQTESMEIGLRNKLWNVICQTYFHDAPPWKNAKGDTLHYSQIRPIFQKLWHAHFKGATDRIPLYYTEALIELRSSFFENQWYEPYNLIQFLADEVRSDLRQRFIDAINVVLKEELAGYQFVSGKLVPITSEAEIATIEQATSLPDSFKPVRDHLKQALALLAQKPTPDYRNSIKESISAVESLSKKIAKLPDATLSPALNAIEKTTALHGDLKDAFKKLYWYTSDDDGIRHAMMDEPNLDLEDAKFMLVSCSAFVNYLVVKAQKAGIAL